MELIVDALNRLTSGKDENNKTIFEIEEDAIFGSTTTEIMQPTFATSAMSPAPSTVRNSPRPSPRLNNLR